ncbi:MAG TPA: HEAT repeat domain-containing protein [Planctomycetota bacterium]|nr:HEAT repeat domain-containing protein [Planctomycetota bacterium]
MDEVVRDLVVNLSRDKVAAQDAALKLSRLGKRSIPVLADLLKSSLIIEKEEKDEKNPTPKTAAQKGNPHLAYYTALALSRIKLADAAKQLLPALESPKVDPNLRQLAIEALGLEFVPEAGAVLQKIAATDADIELRRKAYGQLTIMPNFWASSEKLFVDALSDPDDEIRALAAKQCMFTRIYLSGTEKLIDLAEKDPQPTVRANAMLALSRMRATRAVPMLVRVCSDAQASAATHTAALRTLNLITGMGLKDSAAVEKWWKNFGEKEYTKPAPPQLTPADAPAQPKISPPAPSSTEPKEKQQP